MVKLQGNCWKYPSSVSVGSVSVRYHDVALFLPNELRTTHSPSLNLLASIQGAGVHMLRKAPADSAQPSSGPAATSSSSGTTSAAVAAGAAGGTAAGSAAAGGNDLASALAAALSQRKGKLADSDDEDEEEDDWDD